MPQSDKDSKMHLYDVGPSAGMEDPPVLTSAEFFEEYFEEIAEELPVWHSKRHSYAPGEQALPKRNSGRPTPAEVQRLATRHAYAPGMVTATSEAQRPPTRHSYAPGIQISLYSLMQM
jgi:hypothetical protein